MQFARQRNASTPEERLARWALGFLSSSLVMFFAFMALALTLAMKSAWPLLLVACLGIYAGQFRYLGAIGRFSARQRLWIWQLSLLGHLLMFALALYFLGEPTLALVVLLPETASAALHLAGVVLALKAWRAAQAA
ncbi:MAG: hypothetical protein U1E77_09825 [Inhella sp.]